MNSDRRGSLSKKNEIQSQQSVQEGVERSHEVAALRRQLEKVVSVQESERQHISRDLHDTLGQLLTGLRMQLALLHNKLERPDTNRADSISSVQHADEIVARIQRSLNHLVSLLQPKVVIEEGLAAAIHFIVRENERYGNIQYRTVVEIEGHDLDPNRAIAVYRIIQECLTNVLRHARASRVEIRCVYELDNLVVQIEDDGVGFDTTAESSVKRWGLFGIRSRVELLDGTISIRSAPGKGTRVYIEIPIDEVEGDCVF